MPPDVAALAARLAAGTGWSPEETAERAANWLRELDGDACKLRELLTTAERVRPRAPSQWMAGAITKALEVKAARAAALSRAVVVAAGLRRAPPPRAEALARFEDGVRGNTDPRRARFAAGKAMARLRARREQVEAESMNGETGA